VALNEEPAPSRARAAARVAAVLREEILSRAVAQPGDTGFFLGSEDQLMGRLGISRPTLRQAARILESEHLLEVRQGLHGGMFGRSPGPTAVTHTTSVFLRAQGASLRDVMAVQMLITPACARSAADHHDAVDRAALVAFVDHLEQALEEADSEADRQALYSPARFGFNRTLAQLCANPVLRLYQLVLSEIVQSGRRRFVEPRHVAFTMGYYRQVATSVADGDAGGAEEHARRGCMEFLRWVEEDPSPDLDPLTAEGLMSSSDDIEG
jgi:DNA-binding FadR family transcriptional regulator